MSTPAPPKAPVANWIKWSAVLGLGGLIGLGEIFTDSKFPGWWDVVRHAGGGIATAAIGLKVTLTKTGS